MLTTVSACVSARDPSLIHPALISRFRFAQFPDNGLWRNDHGISFYIKKCCANRAAEGTAYRLIPGQGTQEFKRCRRRQGDPEYKEKRLLTTDHETTQYISAKPHKHCETEVDKWPSLPSRVTFVWIWFIMTMRKHVFFRDYCCRQCREYVWIRVKLHFRN